MACERCWTDAFMRARMFGGHQADHYRDLLDERRDNPCPVEDDTDKAEALKVHDAVRAVRRDRARKEGEAAARRLSRWGGAPNEYPVEADTEPGGDPFDAHRKVAEVLAEYHGPEAISPSEPSPPPLPDFPMAEPGGEG